MRIGILFLGLLTGASAFATDNDLSYGGGFFNYEGRGNSMSYIWLGKYQVRKEAACTDGTNVYAYVTDCVRPATSGSSENAPLCEVGGYEQFLVRAPINYQKWVCLQETGTSNESRGCSQWGQAPAQLDVSGVFACSQQQQQQQRQPSQKRPKQSL